MSGCLISSTIFNVSSTYLCYYTFSNLDGSKVILFCGSFLQMELTLGGSKMVNCN